MFVYTTCTTSKRCDAFNNASFGTNLGEGAVFSEPPILPHGLNGIIISYYARKGKSCTIHQYVTIAGENKTSVIIGDNVFIGARAVILPGVVVGNNVRIGANAVVVHDVPSNCTVVGVPARVVRTCRREE